MPLHEIRISPGPTLVPPGVCVGDTVAKQNGGFAVSNNSTSGPIGKGAKTANGEEVLFCRYSLAGIPTRALLRRAKFELYAVADPVCPAVFGGAFRVGLLEEDGKWDVFPGWIVGAFWYVNSSSFPHPTASGSDAIIGGKLISNLFFANVVNFFALGDPSSNGEFLNGTVTTIGDSLYAPDYVLDNGVPNALAFVISSQMAIGQIAVVFDPFAVPAGATVAQVYIRHEDSLLNSMRGVQLVIEYELLDEGVCSVGSSVGPAVESIAVDAGPAVDSVGYSTAAAVASVAIESGPAVESVGVEVAPAVSGTVGVEEC